MGGADVGEGSIGGTLANLVIPPGKTPDLDTGYDMPTSSCTGNKKSVFIGINYFGQSGELRGCINDVTNIKEFVVNKWQFPTDADHMLVLTDDQSDEQFQPTRENIIRAMHWLVEGAQEGDSLFFHYSGHGGTQKDDAQESDEADGQDETLIPVDYKTNGVIVDDEIHRILVAPLPRGVRITAITDCCHSGSIFEYVISRVSFFACAPHYKTTKWCIVSDSNTACRTPTPLTARWTCTKWTTVWWLSRLL